MERPLAETIPTSSGVYLYKDAQNKIIYVGKAVNLRKRVFSYFRPDHALTPKTRLMLSHALSIDTITTMTEKEALLLEASLIKKHRPRYNIVLRDDKQYVLYKFSVKDPYPRLEITRAVKKDGAKYYGPFTSGFSAKETWKNIHRIFPLRRCSDKSFNNRVRPCLYHYIGQCLAPCTEEVSTSEYAKVVHKVSMLLNGKSKELREEISQAMMEASENLDFEQAALHRDQLQAIEKTLEKQSVVLTDGSDRDILGLVESSYGLSLGLVFVRNGLMIDSRTFHWQGLGFEESHELLLTFLTQYYSSAYIPEHILLPFIPQSFDSQLDRQLDNQIDEKKPERVDDNKINNSDRFIEKTDEKSVENSVEKIEEKNEELEALAQMLTELRANNLNISAQKIQAQVRIRLPKSQDENRLVEIAQQNARESLRNKTQKPIGDILAPYFSSEKAIERIECVDVSHTFGASTKVGMVVFDKGVEMKEEYRAWNIDANGDDYLALASWAKLRIISSFEGKRPFPDLLLIDGGKGQLSATYKALQDAFIECLQKNLDKENGIDSNNVALPFFVASIAKARDEDGKQDRRAGNTSDRIFIPLRSNPLNMKSGSAELLYLQKIRDAAHNYSISKHRKARTKHALQSELLRLPNVGEKTVQALWQHFTSIDAMLKASPQELAKVPSISLKRAEELHKKLQSLHIS